MGPQAVGHWQSAGRMISDPSVAMNSAYQALNLPPPANVPVPMFGDVIENLQVLCQTGSASDSKSAGVGVLGAIDNNHYDVVTRPRYSPSFVWFFCSEKPPPSNAAIAIGRLGSSLSWAQDATFRYLLGAEPRPKIILAVRRGVGGMCAPGTSVVGVTLVVGPSDLALPSVAINRMTLHCGSKSQPAVTPADSSSSRGGPNAPPPPADQQPAGSSSGRDSPASQAGTVGAAVGGAVGGVAVVAVTVSLIVMLKRKSRDQAPNVDTSGKPAGLSDSGRGRGTQGSARPMRTLQLPIQPPQLEAPSSAPPLAHGLPRGTLTTDDGCSVQLGRMLASGATAWVYEGTCSTYGQVAVKVWVQQEDQGGQEGEGRHARVQREVSLLTTHLAHPFLVRGLWAHLSAAPRSSNGVRSKLHLRPVPQPAAVARDEVPPSTAAAAAAAAVQIQMVADVQAAAGQPSLSCVLPAARRAQSHASTQPASAPGLLPSQQHQRQQQHGAAAPSYVVMELGQHTLAHALHCGTNLDLNKCLKYVYQVACALGYLHSRGVAHGDMKPSNVLLVDGMAKLADLGLAHPCTPVPVMSLAAADHGAGVLEAGRRAAQALVDLTSGSGVNTKVPWEQLWPLCTAHSDQQDEDKSEARGSVSEGPPTSAHLDPDSRSQHSHRHTLAGTVAYLAPECMHDDGGGGQGSAATASPPSRAVPGPGSRLGGGHLQAGGSAADVWALGVMLGEVITRQLPWQGLRAERIVCLVGLMGQKPYPLLPRQGVPSGLPELVDACCSAQPEQRPTAAQVAAMLAHMLGLVGSE